MKKAPIDRSQPLYKYMCRAFKANFLKHGIFRLGTLHDFRGREHRLGIGDPTDSRAIATAHVPYATETDIDSHPSLKGLFEFPRGGPGPKIILENMYRTRSEDSIDSYVYCMTRVATPEGLAMSGYDSCVRIRNPLKFQQLVADELRRGHKVKPTCEPEMDSCAYGPHRRSWADAASVPPEFYKREEFAYQDEVRMVWREALQHPLQPIRDFCCPAIVDLLDDYPLPIVPPPLENPLGPKIGHEALVSRTESLVDRMVVLLTPIDNALSGVSTPRQVSSEDRHRWWTDARSALHDGMIALHDQIECLLREYLARGLYDARIEGDRTADPAIAYASQNLAAGLQRFAESVELHLITSRPMRLAMASRYRLWYDGSVTPYRDEPFIKELILEARSNELRIAWPDREPSRHGWIDLTLNDEEREALCWLVIHNRVTPSEVLEVLLRAHYRFPS